MWGNICSLLSTMYPNPEDYNRLSTCCKPQMQKVLARSSLNLEPKAQIDQKHCKPIPASQPQRYDPFQSSCKTVKEKVLFTDVCVVL